MSSPFPPSPPPPAPAGGQFAGWHPGGPHPQMPGHLPSPPTRERPGFGFALVGLGLLLALLCFFVLSWIDGPGAIDTFTDLRDALADAGDASDVSPAGRMYASWVAFTTLLLVGLVALPAAFGLSSAATVVCRTLTVVGALGAAFVHYVGVWQIFYDDTDVIGIGAWLVYPAYGMILVGAAIGPKKVPAWQAGPR